VFKKIIVAIDFTETSARAARAAVGLAKNLGAEVVLVHVIAAGSDINTPDESDGDEIRVGIETQLKELCATLATGGVEVDWGVVNGTPADELAKFARLWNGDLIAVGTAGRTGISRVVMGSVADKLVRFSPVPVLVVGPDAKV
jgi:nucleotide-binding universal stress UspA family protein